MDPEDYAKQGVDMVYPEYNWMPSTGVQRGNIKSTPIRGDPQTPGWPSVGRTITPPINVSTNLVPVNKIYRNTRSFEMVVSRSPKRLLVYDILQ